MWLATMPLFHPFGGVCCVLGAVSVRAANVLVEDFEPGLVLELFGTFGGAAMGWRGIRLARIGIAFDRKRAD